MKKAFFSVALSNFTGAGLGFCVNIVLARMLDLHSFGKANLIFAIIMIFFTVADFGFSNCLVIFHNRHRDQAAFDTIQFVNRLYLQFLAFIATISMVVLFFLRSLYDLTVLEMLVILGSFLLFSIYRYLAAIHQAVGDWTRFNFLTLLNNLLKLVFVAAAIVLLTRVLAMTTPYEATLYGYLIYSMVLFSAALYFTRNFIHIAQNVHDEYRREFFNLLYPIGTASIFIIITMRFDSLVIEKYLGSEALGIYSAANTLALVFPLVTGSLMNVLLRESAGRKEEYLVKVLFNQKKYFLMLITVFVLASAVSKYVIIFLFGQNFQDAADIFRILLIAYIGGVFFTPLESYFYANAPKTIVYMRLAQMLILILLALAFVGLFKLHGIAMSIVISRLIAWVYFYFKSHNIVTGMKNASIS